MSTLNVQVTAANPEGTIWEYTPQDGSGPYRAEWVAAHAFKVGTYLPPAYQPPEPTRTSEWLSADGQCLIGTIIFRVDFVTRTAILKKFRQVEAERIWEQGS